MSGGDGEAAHRLRLLKESLFWSLAMKTSAPNALRGTVTAVTDGAVNAEVTLKIADGVTVWTRGSASSS
jgi:molybdate transport system regulatory protein